MSTQNTTSRGPQKAEQAQIEPSFDQRNRFLRELSPQAFRTLGVEQIAYIRPHTTSAGEGRIAVYGADGTRLALMEDLDAAVEAVHRNDMAVGTLH